MDINKHYYDSFLYTFKKISMKKWIEGVSEGTNDVGLTFERELNKKPDSLFLPDYMNIEIKCLQRFSRFPINLFTLAFDGPSLFQTNIILEKYGVNDHQYRDKKKLIADLYFNKIERIYGRYLFKLELDRVEKKMFLCVFDLEGNLIERDAYIDFDTMQKRLEIKLSHMALVHASKMIINDKRCFRYYEVKICELRSFDKFLDLLEKDILNVSICLRISRSGDQEGRQRNKGICFKIKEDKLEELFTIVKRCNTDEDWHY